MGAYLLSLWGLPDTIIESVAHHHDPGSVDILAFDGIAAVHIANALANEVEPVTQDDARAPVDAELVDRLGLGPRLPVWRERSRALAESGFRPLCPVGGASEQPTRSASRKPGLKPRLVPADYVQECDDW